MIPPAPASLVLVLEDSQVSRVQALGADVRLTLSSAHVAGPHGCFKDAPGESEGYLAPLVLLFRQAFGQGELAQGMGRLVEGELRMAGRCLRRLPLPFESAGPVHARLAFANGVVLEIQAKGLECPLDGDETYTASFAC